jgi:hypothetical protein
MSPPEEPATDDDKRAAQIRWLSSQPTSLTDLSYLTQLFNASYSLINETVTRAIGWVSKYFSIRETEGLSVGNIRE